MFVTHDPGKPLNAPDHLGGPELVFEVWPLASPKRDHRVHRVGHDTIQSS